jgi:hypothetical protein
MARLHEHPYGHLDFLCRVGYLGFNAGEEKGKGLPRKLDRLLSGQLGELRLDMGTVGFGRVSAPNRRLLRLSRLFHGIVRVDHGDFFLRRLVFMLFGSLK